MTESIIEVIEAGFEVTSPYGGYVAYAPGSTKPWLHQTNFRSSDFYDNPHEAVSAFIQEYENSKHVRNHERKKND